jgi:hypothetical protein
MPVVVVVVPKQEHLVQVVVQVQQAVHLTMPQVLAHLQIQDLVQVVEVN